MSKMSVSWRAPLTLAALCILPFLLQGSSDPDTLRERLLEGDCEALPVLARYHPELLNQELQETLLLHPDHRLRELVAHQAWIPHVSLQSQADAVAKLEPVELRERALLWLSRRTTSQLSLTLEDLASYWSSRDS